MLTASIHEEQNLPLAPFRSVAEAPNRQSWTEIGSSQGLDRRIRRSQAILDRATLLHPQNLVVVFLLLN